MNRIDITPATVALFLKGDVRGLSLKLYLPGDEKRVTARADFAKAYAREGSRLPDGPKWTLGDGGTVLGVGGLEPLGEGNWGAWAYLADLTPRQWWWARMMAKAVIGYARRHFRVVCITARAADAPGAGRLLERLGFIACDDEDPRSFILLGDA